MMARTNLAALAVAALLVLASPSACAAEAVQVSTWAELSAAITSADPSVEIAIMADITLEGVISPDSGDTVSISATPRRTLTAKANSRLFTVEDGETLSLTGLTLTGGRTDDAWNGGGAGVVYGAGASFTALDVLFSDNEAITGGDGGAVSVHGGTATFTQCSFVGNKAHDWGGALYFTGRAVTTITVTDCTFVSNYADCEGWDEPEDCGADVFTSTTDITLTCSADGCGDDGTFGDTACTKLYEGDSQEKFLCTPTCASCASCGEAPLGAALAVAQACGGSCNDQVESALGLACSCGGGATGATGTAADIISESTDTCGCTAPAGCSGGGGSGSGSGGDDEPCTGADCPCEGAACDTTCSVDNVSQDITFTIVGFENHGLSASDAEVGLQNFMRQNTDDNDADVTVSASGEVTMRVTRCPDEVVTEANVVDALNDALGTTAGEWAITNLEVSDSDSAATAAASMLALVVVVAAAAATLR